MPHPLPATGDGPQGHGEILSTEPDVTDLKFREFFKMPIGPNALEPTEKLIALHGKSVRIRGCMAKQEMPTPGMFILSPLPVELGDEDESLADDLPPAVVFVHWEDKSGQPVSYVPGVIQLNRRSQQLNKQSKKSAGTFAAGK